MTAIISSRTPEGEPARCPICGAIERIEPSRPPGDAPCPGCGGLLWFDRPTSAIVGRPNLNDHVEGYLRSEPRRNMFSLRATLGRVVRRAISRARPSRRSVPASAESSGVYDRWLDG